MDNLFADTPYNGTSLLWAFAGSLLLLALLAGGGLLANRIWNDRMKRVKLLLREIAERHGRMDFAFSTGPTALLVSRDFIHYLSLRRVQVEATFPMSEVASLKITESSRFRVRFSFELRGGKETRTLWTNDISRFAELFNVMVDRGKEIRYLRG